MEDLLNIPIVSPGNMLSRILSEKKWSQSDLAEITGLSDKTISMLIKDKQAITTDTAVLLAAATGKNAQYWLNLYAKYQIEKDKSENNPKAVVAKARAEIRTYMPVSEMKKLGWFVNDISTVQGIENEYERIFGSRSLPHDVYENFPVPIAARQTKADAKLTKYHLTTWFSFAKVHAHNLLIAKTPRDYDKAKLELISKNLYRYTTKADGVEQVLEDLYESGLNFLVLSHLPQTYLDGAAFMCENRPFVAYTARQDREDNFWFVLAHEIAHILLHYDFLSNPFLDDMDDFNSVHRSVMEKEADEKALDSLKSEVVLACGKMLGGKYVTDSKIAKLQEVTEVSPAVMLGMLQHEGIVPWKIRTSLKPKIKERIPKLYVRG